MKESLKDVKSGNETLKYGRSGSFNHFKVSPEK